MNTQIKRIAVGVLVVAVVVAGVFIVRSKLQDRTVEVVVNETIDRPALNLAFTFPSGEAAYSFIEPTIDQNTGTGNPEAVFILIETRAYTEFQSGVSGGATPPSMSVFVYAEPPEEGTSTTATDTPKLDRMTRLRNWATANNALTFFTSARSTPEEVVIDGVKALHYEADGLYGQEFYIFFHKNRYYVFVGQYDGETDQRRAVFQDLIRSITLM